MSYNVFSLFKNVPVDETIETLADKPFRDNQFNRSCYKKPTFPIQRNLDKQVVGVAIGSPQGPLIANAFMCHIEEKSENQNKMPAFYKPYVKDTLSKMPIVSSASVFLPNWMKSTLHSVLQWNLRKIANFPLVEWRLEIVLNYTRRCIWNQVILDFNRITKAMFTKSTHILCLTWC